MKLPDNIIKIVPTNTNFKITWFLEKSCNFHCSYCPPTRHEPISKHTKLKSLKTLQNHWEQLHDKISPNQNIDIFFSGGEVTQNKDFLPFVKWLRNTFKEIDMIGLSSNGSASEKYYVDLINYISHLTLSTHIEFFNEEKFFRTVMRCHGINKTRGTPHGLYVQLMNETFYKNNRIDLYEEFLINMGIAYTRMNFDYPKAPGNYTFPSSVIKPHINTNTRRFNFSAWQP